MKEFDIESPVKRFEMKEFDIESPVKRFEMDENEFVTGDESDIRNPKLPTGLVDGISMTEFSPRPGLPPVSELLPGSSIESKVTLKGSRNLLRGDEFDPEAAARELEWHLKGRKIDFKFERPVKLFERENIEMDYKNLDEFLSKKKIKKNEDESDFGKPMSPTGHPQCLLRLVPEIDIMEELWLKIMPGDELPDFVIVDDKSVTELSPRPGLPPVSSIESKATLKGSRNLMRGDEFDSEAAARELEWHLKGRKIDFKFERPVKKLFERENIEMDYKNLDEFLSKKKIKKNEDESDFGKPMSPTGHPQCLLRLVPEIDIMEELWLKIMPGDELPDFVIVDDKSGTELSLRTSPPCKVGQHESPVKKVFEMDHAESDMKLSELGFAEA